MSVLVNDGRIEFPLAAYVTSFGVFVVFSVPFVGLNKASVKSDRESNAEYRNN